MATFNININSKPELEYFSTNISKASNTCDDFTQSTNIGLVRGPNYNPADGIYYFFTSVTSSFPLANLRIRNITYTNQSQVFLSNGGVTLQPATEYIIDVSTINPDDLIPNLLFEAVNANTSTQALQITAEVALEDNQGTIGDYENITLSYRLTAGCNDVKEAITENSVTVTDCSTLIDLDVNVPSGQTRYVTITTSGSNVVVIPLTNGSTISTKTNYSIEILGAQPAVLGDSTTSTATITVRSAAGGNIIAAKNYTRTHKNALC